MTSAGKAPMTEVAAAVERILKSGEDNATGLQRSVITGLPGSVSKDEDEDQIAWQPCPKGKICAADASIQQYVFLVLHVKRNVS